eukprot:COSAG01_NODE_19167_length_1026_cov_3.224380_1_plen_212_part_00
MNKTRTQPNRNMHTDLDGLPREHAQCDVIVCAKDTRELYAEGSARRCPKCARGVILYIGDMELKCEDQIVAGVIKRQQPGPEVSSRSLDSLLRGRAEFLRTGTRLFQWVRWRLSWVCTGRAWVRRRLLWVCMGRVWVRRRLGEAANTLVGRVWVRQATYKCSPLPNPFSCLLWLQATSRHQVRHKKGTRGAAKAAMYRTNSFFLFPPFFGC